MTNFQTTTVGCLDTSNIPSDYFGKGPIYRDPTNGWCYPVNPVTGKVQYYPQYGYNPALSTGVIFCVLFGLLMIVHFVFALKSKRKWLIVTSVGALGELIGWVGRTLSATDNSASLAAHNYFLIQIVCLTLAPVFFSATCYGVFTILVTKLDLTLSRISPKKLTWTFVVFDIISLLLQAVGGGMTASANDRTSQSRGTNIFLAGIVFQLIVMIIFSVFAIDYFYRLLKTTPRVLTRGYRICTIGMAFASFAIILRGGYRTAELAEGWGGLLLNTEIYFRLAVSHPVFTLPRPSGKSKNATDGMDLATFGAATEKNPRQSESTILDFGSSEGALNKEATSV